MRMRMRERGRMRMRMRSLERMRTRTWVRGRLREENVSCCGPFDRTGVLGGVQAAAGGIAAGDC